MEEKGVWKTIGGRRVFIKEGQSLSEAMKESGKFKSSKKDKYDNMSEFEKNKLYEKLSDEEKEKYNKLKKEIKEAYKNQDYDKAKKLKEERENILINKIEDEQPLIKKEKNTIKKVDYKPLTQEEISLINENINDAIISYGEEGRIDADKNLEAMDSQIYQKARKILKRELTEEDYDYIQTQKDAYYKDGYYVSKNSFSLEEYSSKMRKTMNEVDEQLNNLGFEVIESHSIYSGLMPSRYYIKNGITIRIGDHTNSNNSSPSHTREELYKSTPEELVKYVEDKYNKIKKD